MYYQLKAFSALVPLVTSSIQTLVSQQLKNVSFHQGFELPCTEQALEHIPWWVIERI